MKASQTHMETSIFHMETSLFHMETSQTHMETSMFHMETSLFHTEISLFKWWPVWHTWKPVIRTWKPVLHRKTVNDAWGAKHLCNSEWCVGSQTFVQLVASLVPAEWGWAPAEGVSGVAWGSSFQLVHKHRQFMQLVNNIGSSCS